MLPQKINFQNCFLKKYIFKILPSKNYISNFKKSIASSYNNTFPKLLPQKQIFKITPLKNTFFENHSLKEDAFEIAFSKKNLTALIFSSSEPSESSGELSKSSIISLTTFFSMYLTILKILVNNSFHLYLEQNPS